MVIDIVKSTLLHFRGTTFVKTAVTPVSLSLKKTTWMQ